MQSSWASSSRRAWHPTEVNGTGDRDTLILAIRKAQAKLRRADGAWLLTDTTGKYGTLHIEGIESIVFLDATTNLQVDPPAGDRGIPR